MRSRVILSLPGSRPCLLLTANGQNGDQLHCGPELKSIPFEVSAWLLLDILSGERKALLWQDRLPRGLAGIRYRRYRATLGERRRLTAKYFSVAMTWLR